MPRKARPTQLVDARRVKVIGLVRHSECPVNSAMRSKGRTPLAKTALILPLSARRHACSGLARSDGCD